MPRVCILRQKRLATSSAVAGPSDDWGGRTRASGAAAVSSGTCFQVGVNSDRLRIRSACFAISCCHRRAVGFRLRRSCVRATADFVCHQAGPLYRNRRQHVRTDTIHVHIRRNGQCLTPSAATGAHRKFSRRYSSIDSSENGIPSGIVARDRSRSVYFAHRRTKPRQKQLAVGGAAELGGAGDQIRRADAHPGGDRTRFIEPPHMDKARGQNTV